EGKNYKDLNFSSSHEQIAGQRQVAMEMLYQIKLRLNPDERPHQELYSLLLKSTEQLSEIAEGSKESDETVDLLNKASDSARTVLKAEWIRVKSGERPFQIARNWVAPIIIGLSLVFISVLVFTQFKQT